MGKTLPPVRELIAGADVHPLDILQELHTLFTEARECGAEQIESKLGAHFEARVLTSWELYADDWLNLP